MISSLLTREVNRRPPGVRLSGRVLFLTEDSKLLKKQLGGSDLAWDPSIKLRDNISTDEITPAYICYYFDETLGDFPYLGLKCTATEGGVNREEFPVTRGSVKGGGFVAAVAGKRRGKGSSREQSPYAEMCAGIRVIVAENIERIYKQNCQNLGLYVTTNFDVIEKIRQGEEIPLEEFTRGEDEITRQIVEYGGLFNFNVARIQGRVRLPNLETQPRPMTLAEKIFARHMVVDLAKDDIGVPAVKPGDSGFVRADLRFSHEYVTPMAAIFFEQLVGKNERVNDPSSILFFRDHLTFLDDVMPVERVKMGLLDLAFELKRKQQLFAEVQGIRVHGELSDRKGSEAICHSKVLESYALPGQVVVGSDSHTPHSGAIGCIAFGIGTTDVFNAWITKDVRVRIPETVKIVIHGRKPDNVTAKDMILEILRMPYVKNGEALGKVIEYAGEAIEALSVDERATLTNMAAEVGGFTGIVAPDQKVVDFLVERREMPRSQAERYCEGWSGDPGAQYATVIEIEASRLRPMVALPGDPGNGIFIDELQEEVRIDIAYGGSCTAGKNEDMDMYARVFKEALAQGRHVAPEVRCYIQFGSQETRRYAEQMGYTRLFQEVGAEIIEPSCGACINAGPGASKSKEEVSVSSQNRNFPGRSGPGQVYLASPYTVAASAIAGRIVEYQISNRTK
ncbi:MAG: 3-isopropylmalate dehydratase [Acidobacteriia bacterium]|nr:3-isopropylmalate dehydratase [Terriglobia bacterium]